MEVPAPQHHQDDQINIGDLWSILCRHWWKIALISLVAGALTFLVLLTKPNVYRATAVLTPAAEEKRPNPALGILANIGVDIGSPTRVEDLETLFRSNDLSVRVFRKHNLWPVVYGDRFDAATGKMKPGWTDRLFGGGKGSGQPSDWDAIRAAKDRLAVSVNKKNGTVSVSFDSSSPEGSAAIVAHYLDEGKSRLQEEALDRAVKNKKFIEEQIGKTLDVLTRDRLYSLYGQEVEREMMGRNREQFGFRVVDTPRAPDRKYKPRRGSNALFAAVLAFLAGWVYFVRKRPDIR